MKLQTAPNAHRNTAAIDDAIDLAKWARGSVVLVPLADCQFPAARTAEDRAARAGYDAAKRARFSRILGR